MVGVGVGVGVGMGPLVQWWAGWVSSKLVVASTSYLVGAQVLLVVVSCGHSCNAKVSAAIIVACSIHNLHTQVQ